MSNPSIADLPVLDDLDIPVDPEAYVDQATGPALVTPGNYRLVVTKHKVATKKDGTPLLTKDKWPVITIEQVKIVEPVENERLVGVFTDVRFEPFKRKGPQGQEVTASALYDLLRAYDASARIEGIEHAKQLLQQYLEQTATFLGQIGLYGYDRDYVAVEKAKFTPDTPKDIVNAVYNKAKFSTKNFFVNGQVLASIVSPTSGNTVEARPRIGRFFVSTTEVVEGKAGKNQVVLGPFTK